MGAVYKVSSALWEVDVIMTQIRLIYKEGVFHPLHPVNLQDGDEISVVIDEPPAAEDTQWLQDRYKMEALAGSITGDDATRMINAVEEAFESIDPSSWKAPHVG